MSEPVAFYFDPISPFAFLGSTQIETIAARHGRTVDWRPVLIGITVMKVMGLPPLATLPLKGDYLRHDMDRLAKIYGVDFRRHGLTGVNSVAACRCFLWLKQRDAALAAAFIKRIFARLHQQGEDITAIETCAEEAAALGIDTQAMIEGATSPEGKAALNTAVDDAIAKGVFGVPFFIADGEPFFGCDHLPMMEQWLAHHAWHAS